MLRPPEDHSPSMKSISLVVLTLTVLVSVLGCQSLPRRREAAAIDSAARYRPLMPSFALEPGQTRRQSADYKRQGKPDLAWLWFYNHRVDQTGVVPIAYREEALDHSRKYNQRRPKDVGAAWTYLGPGGQVDAPPNGRITDLVVDPLNEQILYAATAGGGLWKTTDQGLNWYNLTDGKVPTLGVGSIAMDPVQPSTLYIGLGEGNKGHQNGMDPLGTGIYKSTDGGQNWALLPGTGNGVMAFIGDIKLVNSDTILAAAWGGHDQAGRGLFRSTDGGQSWVKRIDEVAVSISIDPTNRSRIAVSTWRGAGATAEVVLYTSADGGLTFNPAVTTPDRSGGRRAELARDPSNPNRLYALVASTNSSIKGIWTSADGGQDWTELPKAGTSAAEQMNYNNCIAVSPADPNRIYLGTNLRSYRSTDGGQSWAAMTDWDPENNAGLPSIHADHHAIAFGASANTIYIGTDGGCFMSTDGGNSWIERNAGLNCTQIYRIDNHPTMANAVIMGTQDNDKYVRRPDGTWRHWPNEFGDCMEVAVDPLDPEGDGFYGVNYFGNLMKYTGNGSQSWHDYLRTYNGFPDAGSMPNGIPQNEQGAWVTPFLLDPQQPRTAYVVLNHIYRTQFTPGAVPQWEKLLEMDQQFSHTFEHADLSSGLRNRQIYVATNRFDQTLGAYVPGLLRMDIGDGSGAISEPRELDPPRQGILGRIKCDPAQNDWVWLCYTDYGQGKDAPNGRIYLSTDRGQTWTDKTGNLPRQLPVSAIFIDPLNPSTVIVGTDLGCYRTDDHGVTWYEFNAGLPMTVVTDLAYFAPQRLLRAGTFGRGMWETGLDGAGVADIAVQPASVNFSLDTRRKTAGTTGLQPGDAALDAPPPRPVIPEALRDAKPIQLPKGQLGILNDSFEVGDTLAAGWYIPATDDPHWWFDDLRKNSGLRALWCAAGGSLGRDPQIDSYPANFMTSLTFGPFSLADATAASFQFWYDLDTDAWNGTTGDLFYVLVYRNQTEYGYYVASGLAANQNFTVDLSNVSGLGNILGNELCYVQFQFVSDANYNLARYGVWIDDVVLNKTTAALGTPTGLTASTNLTDRVTLSWNPLAGALAYYVYRNTSNTTAGASIIAGPLSGTTFDDTTAAPGVDYFYYVLGVNSTEISSFSNSVLGRRKAPIQSPVASATIHLTDRVEITWNDVGASSYFVSRSEGVNDLAQAKSITPSMTETFATDRNVRAGVNYYYFVRGLGSEPVWSEGVLGRVGSVALLAGPGGVAASSNLLDHVRVTWNANVPQATDYQVYRTTGVDNPSAALPISPWIAEGMFDDHTALPGITYFYYVKARNAQTGGHVSATATGRLAPTVLAPQTFTVRNIGNASFTIYGVVVQSGSTWLGVVTADSLPRKLAPGQELPVTVIADPTGLGDGRFSDRVLVVNDVVGRNPMLVDVTLSKIQTGVELEVWEPYE